jgi:hypothetical protein
VRNVFRTLHSGHAGNRNVYVDGLGCMFCFVPIACKKRKAYVRHEVLVVVECDAMQAGRSVPMFCRKLPALS